MILDTGSSNSWVSSFEPTKSTGGTYFEPGENDKKHVKITFGSGYLKGFFVKDQVTIGDVSDDAEDD